MTDTEQSPENENEEEFRQDLSEAVYECMKILENKGVVDLKKVKKATSEKALKLGESIADLIFNFINDLSIEEEEELFSQSEIEMPVENFTENVTNMESESQSSSESSESNSHKNSQGYKPEKEKRSKSPTPLAKKIEIINLKREHPNWKFSTLKVHAGKYLTRMDELNRWKKDVIKGGTKFDKSYAIKNWTWKKFDEARKKKFPVTTRDVQVWALQGAQQFKQFNYKFTASMSWVNRFKKQYRISQRKVTRYVKPTEHRSPEQLLQAAEKFQAECLKLTKNSNLDYVINTDQMGCEYRAGVSRTLEHTGEKIVEVFVGDVNKVTHSYTAQYTITASGKILPKVFLCLQEVGGNFGPRIQKDIENYTNEYSNVYIVCSRSGKLSTQLYSSYIDNILEPYVVDKSFTLIIDSWSGQSSKLFERFALDDENSLCTLKYIPPGCTKYCQPLDTTLHRQLKIFIRRLQGNTFLNENNRQINTRDDAVKIHALVLNQICAPIYKSMIEYSWFSANLIDHRDVFMSVKEVTFPPNVNWLR